MRHVAGRQAHGVERQRCQGIAGPMGMAMIGDAAARAVELDTGPDAGTGPDIAVKVHRHLLAVEKVDGQGEWRHILGHAQAGEALAAFDHGAEGQCLEAVEIGQAGGIGPIRPAVPQRMQGVADFGIRVARARLDAGPHRVGGQRLHRRRHPWVVAGVPAGPPRSRGGAGLDRAVEAVHGAGAVPTPTATSRVKRAAAVEANGTEKGFPHASDYRRRRIPWLFGEFGKDWWEAGREVIDWD
ncbi:hypothetical protein MTBLM5_520005 [Magnetospirillum sp. LM-5]|nr:hypothetical protein MTBLM5_520005 [Magnetospirillum sp. LM-5]